MHGEIMQRLLQKVKEERIESDKILQKEEHNETMRIQYGNVLPSIGILVRIAYLFKVSTDFLLAGEEIGNLDTTDRESIAFMPAEYRKSFLKGMRSNVPPFRRKIGRGNFCPFKRLSRTAKLRYLLILRT